VNDREYIQQKLKHLKLIGLKADTNPTTGAARPDWAKAEAEARDKRIARRAAKSVSFGN
jgi:hypothetical protein